MSKNDRHDPSARPVYTKDQLFQYFDRISLPQSYRDSPVLTDPSLAQTLTHGLPLLRALQMHQLSSIPFENLSLHYSATKTITLDPLSIFNKMVTRNTGRGGYCMENNQLMLTVLRTLGYTVTPTGARISSAIQPRSDKDKANDSESSQPPTPRYDGWSHMVNLVRLETHTFLVDVGVGSMGPTRPIELIDNTDAHTISARQSGTGEEGFINVPPAQRSRLTKKPIPDTSSSSVSPSHDDTMSPSQNNSLWVYETRYADHKPWTPVYCFSEQEFLPNDFEVMNFWTSKSPSSWFTHRVVCVRMVLGRTHDHDTHHDHDGEVDGGTAAGGDDESPEREIVGDLTCAGNEVKRRIRGRTEVLATFGTEVQRVEALERWFGITLDKEERGAIEGMDSAL